MSMVFVCQSVIFYEIMCSLLVVCRCLILFMKLTRAFTPFSSMLHSPTYSGQNSSGITDSVWNFQTLGVIFLGVFITVRG